MKRKKTGTGRKCRPSQGVPTQGDSFEELLSNLYEAVEGCLSVEVRDIPVSETDKIIEIAV